MKSCLIDGKSVVVVGKLVRIAKLQDEYYVPFGDPDSLLAKMRPAGIKADLLTFVQEIHEGTPKYGFHQESDTLAVLPLGTYDDWLNKRINFRPRNKIRKAMKSGVEVRVVEFTDDFVRGIMGVYDESPVRQGQRNRHYGQDFDTVKGEHATFFSCSEFIGAFYENQLIGFVKVTHVKNYSILMNIVAMIKHRDKAPTNALVAKTVEVCAARNSQYLMYSTWGRQEGLNEFKSANGFERVEIPRYFIPLTCRGKLALWLNLHRSLNHYIPENLIKRAVEIRTKWNRLRYGNQSETHSATKVASASQKG